MAMTQYTRMHTNTHIRACMHTYIHTNYCRWADDDEDDEDGDDKKKAHSGQQGGASKSNRSGGDALVRPSILSVLWYMCCSNNKQE